MRVLTTLSLAEARAGLAAKEFSASELVQAHLDAIGTDDLNAFILVTPERALEMAKRSDQRIAAGAARPLEGLPVGVKDLFCTEGVATTAGSRILEGFVPPYESTVTARLWDAGAVLVGKTNLDEFAMGSSTVTSYFQPTINPWTPTNATPLVPGGSSGGSTAAVAARLCPAAIGTDTGGSIRQPAAFCGVVGMKPTYGRCSRFGIVAFASSLDQAGPITRTVADCALLLQQMAGYDPQDSTSADRPIGDLLAALTGDVRGLRVGIPKEYRLDGTPPEIAALWQQGIDWLKGAGCTIADVSLPHTRYALPAYYIVAPAEASSNLARYDGMRFGLRVAGDDLIDTYARTRAAGFGQEVRRRVMIGTYVLSAGYYNAYYIKAQKVRSKILQDFERVFETVDVLLTPTTPNAAFRIGEKMDDPIQMYLNDVFTVPANLAGLPGISVPAGLSRDGLPLGLQLIGRPFDEATVLRAAGVLEEAAGFNALPPWLAEKGVTMADVQERNLIQGATGPWEVVVGLEVHAQIVSNAKLFSGASAAFGGSPNSHVSFIDAGMPGMLPSVNGFCIEQAVRTGLGLKAKINKHSVFERKNYFYPDLPNGYQISQYAEPLVGHGRLTIDLPDGATKAIGITRLHVEMDAGKSLHDQRPDATLVDLNRSGVALMEIVSEPDVRSAEEAVLTLRKLRSILRYLGTCDGNMEEGSLRCDANVSVRRPGHPLGTRCEIKNLNSMRFVGRAIEYEAKRQIDILEAGGRIEQETRLFDANRGETRSMRTKEEAHDYRYFPDPDLLPLELDNAFIARIEADLPELPDAKKTRFIAQYGLSTYDAEVLVAERAAADYFEQAAEGHDPKLVANWVTGDLFGALNRAGLDIGLAPITPERLGKLVGMIQAGTISGRIAKDVFQAMFETGADPERIVAEQGFAQISDTGQIETIVDGLIAANPAQVASYQRNPKALGWFVGQVMKATKGQANPQVVNELLHQKLRGS